MGLKSGDSIPILTRSDPDWFYDVFSNIVGFIENFAVFVGFVSVWPVWLGYNREQQPFIIVYLLMFKYIEYNETTEQPTMNVL